jgi:hypothetical protein
LGGQNGTGDSSSSNNNSVSSSSSSSSDNSVGDATEDTNEAFDGICSVVKESRFIVEILQASRHTFSMTKGENVHARLDRILIAGPTPGQEFIFERAVRGCLKILIMLKDVTLRSAMEFRSKGGVCPMNTCGGPLGKGGKHIWAGNCKLLGFIY